VQVTRYARRRLKVSFPPPHPQQARKWPLRAF